MPMDIKKEGYSDMDIEPQNLLLIYLTYRNIQRNIQFSQYKLAALSKLRSSVSYFDYNYQPIGI